MLSSYFLFILLSLLYISYSQQGQTEIGCDLSDERLIYLKDVLCSSLGETTVTVHILSDQ